MAAAVTPIITRRSLTAFNVTPSQLGLVIPVNPRVFDPLISLTTDLVD